MEALRELIYTGFFGKCLDLSGKNLTKVPQAVTKLTELEVLDLSWNQLTTLPDDLCELVNLTVLNVMANKLTGLPRTFSQLKKLEYLGLSSNQLSGLPAWIEELEELIWLLVDDNPFTVEGTRMVMKMQNRIKYGADVSGKDKKLNVHCLYSCELNCALQEQIFPCSVNLSVVYCILLTISLSFNIA